MLHGAGRFAGVIEMQDQVMREAVEIGHIGAWFLADITRGSVAWSMDGNVSNLERFGRHGVEAWAALGAWSGAGNLFLAIAQLESGAMADPASLLVEMGMTFGNEAWTDIAWGDYFLHSAQTHPERALAVLDRYAHLLPVLGQPAPAGAYGALFRVIRGLATLGERGRASSLYPQCVEALRRGRLVDTDAVIESECGIAAAAGEQWELAEQHFVNALQTALTVPHLPAQGDVRRWHAWMLLSRRAPGDVERAQAMLRDAVALFERIGLPRRARNCNVMLAEANMS